MKSTMNYLSGILLFSLLLAGAVVVMSSGRVASIGAAPLDEATSLMETTSARLSAVAALPDDIFQIDATLLGTVDLEWGAMGVFSDTWAADELNVLSDGATIDITFLLEKDAGDAVTGYLELQNSLVFTTEHIISTTVASDVGAPVAEAVTREVGPQSTGSYVGTQLNLTSERVSYMTESGQDVERQFRLTAGPNQGSELLTGEYRETVWGLTLKPVTVGGAFTLRELKATPADINRAPIAAPQTVTTQADTAKAITLAGSDDDNDAITFEIVTEPVHGTLTGTAPIMTYTPDANYEGSDSFTFKVNDGKVESDSAAVSIVVSGGSSNRPPTAVADSATTPGGVAITINVLANDSDPDGDALTVTVNEQPKNGSAEVNGLMIVYTPNGSFSGADTFTYTVTDSKGATDSAQITITVEERGATIYLPIIQKQ